MDCIECRNAQGAIKPGPLVEALLAILREADEYSDEELVARAISLQDRLLKLDIYGVDKLLDEASRDW